MTDLPNDPLRPLQSSLLGARQFPQALQLSHERNQGSIAGSVVELRARPRKALRRMHSVPKNRGRQAIGDPRAVNRGSGWDF